MYLSKWSRPKDHGARELAVTKLESWIGAGAAAGPVKAHVPGGDGGGGGGGGGGRWGGGGLLLQAFQVLLVGDGHHLRHDVLFLPVCKHTHTQFLQLWTDKSGSHGSSMSTNTHTHSSYSSGQTSWAVMGVQRLQTHTHTVPTALDRQVGQSWEFNVHEHTHSQCLQLWTDKSGSHWSSASANTRTHTHTQSSYSSGQTSWAVMGVQCPQTHTHAHT